MIAQFVDRMNRRTCCPVSLSLHPGMREEDVRDVIEAVTKLYPPTVTSPLLGPRAAA